MEEAIVNFKNAYKNLKYACKKDSEYFSLFS